MSLGTSHVGPPAGTVWARLDQSRGLLDDVNRHPCAENVKYTSVAGVTPSDLLAKAVYYSLSGWGGEGFTEAMV